MSIALKLEERVERYEYSRDVVAINSLGVGTQGTVLMYNNPSRSAPIAVKFHERNVAYERELGVYHRLSDLEIESVAGHAYRCW